jgi:hypothetical protein
MEITIVEVRNQLFFVDSALDFKDLAANHPDFKDLRYHNNQLTFFAKKNQV